MLKKMLLAAVAVMALAAVAVPSASATVTHNHKAIEVKGTETFTGEALFQSPATGQVKCTNAEGWVEFFPGQTVGTVEKFTCPSPTTNAHVTGAIAAICGGQTILHEVRLTKHAKAQIVTNPVGTPAITITEIELLNSFTNAAHQQICVTTELTDDPNSTPVKDVVATPNNAQTIGFATLSGTLTAHGFGQIHVSGKLIPHKVTYGIVAP